MLHNPPLMLRLFFNRNSPIMKSFYWLGALLSLLFLWQGHWSLLNTSQKVLLGLFWLQVLFAQALLFYPFYPKNAPGPGITLQFQKALVPIAYLWPSAMILLWLQPLAILMILFNVLILPISSVACILIYFYSIDPERQNTNVLTGQHTPH